MHNVTMSDLVLRDAVFEELRTLYVLSGVSCDQHNYPNKWIDLDGLQDSYKNVRYLYEASYQANDEICFVAEAPAFETDYPLYGHNGQQICGFASGKFEKSRIHTHLLLEDFYAVKSPFRTGKPMMEKLVETAMDHQAKSIQLYALYEQSALWYKQAGFKYTDTKKKSGAFGKMVLFEDNFENCLQKLNAPRKRDLILKMVS